MQKRILVSPVHIGRNSDGTARVRIVEGQKPSYMTDDDFCRQMEEGLDTIYRLLPQAVADQS